MRLFFLRLRVMWRRFWRGERYQQQHYAAQVDILMRRANPFASWLERANWIVDIVQWVRHKPKVSLLEERTWHRVKQQRIQFLLEWLDQHRDMRRVVQTTLQKTLREASGPELFCVTGLPHEPAFFSELSEHIVGLVLPRPPSTPDLSTLLTAMFPTSEDADWLLDLNPKIAARLWKLAADDGIAHMYQRQIDEALIYLVTVILADGVSAAFRHRLDPKVPLQATPFMVLRRELETYLYVHPKDASALRSVRMLIAVCQAQTDRIYAHLDENGVSVSLVYRVERMRAQLQRMARLIDLRALVNSEHDTVLSARQVQVLLADFIVAHYRRTSVRGLVRRSFSLLARKMVERNADRGEQYIARDRHAYRVMLKAACCGGVVIAFTVLGKVLFAGAGLARFFEGIFVALNYTVSFLTVSAIGGVLAAKQPVVTAPMLAAKMSQLDATDGLRTLLTEVTLLLRSQAAAVFGNLLTVTLMILLIFCMSTLFFGTPLMTSVQADASLHHLSVIGPTPLFAALTGILLWLSSLSAGFADNWFALRRLREAVTHQRRLVHVLGARRAERWANWLERNVVRIVGNVSLGLLLGMTPVVAQFFGLPLDVRHVTLSMGLLTAAASSLGWSVLLMPQFWLALAGIAVIGLLNVGVAFACALVLALQAHDVPVHLRRLVLRTVLWRFSTSPQSFLLPQPLSGIVEAVPPIVVENETVTEIPQHVVEEHIHLPDDVIQPSDQNAQKTIK